LFQKLILCLASLGLGGFIHAQQDARVDAVPTDSPVQTERASDPSASFPTQLAVWEQSEAEMIDGIAKAEALRLRLLSTNSQGHRYLDLIATELGKLQTDCQQLKRELTPIDAFDLRASRLREQIAGEQLVPRTVFDRFDGQWFGTWRELTVNHDWKPSQQFEPARSLMDSQPAILTLQYAWIGNGFGWNYLAQDASQSDRRDSPGHYVLGMVYYLDASDYDVIVDETPHVGFADGENRLLWITARGLYLEEAFYDLPREGASQRSDRPDRYVITAITHSLLSDKPSVDPVAIQATYTRDPNARPAFREFTWTPSISKKK
jgi:hypothetical protein